MIRLQIQSDAQETALDLVRSALAVEACRLQLGLEATQRHLHTFEKRYSVTSEVFLREFTAESLTGGDQEYVAWTGELQLYHRIAAQLDTLRDVQSAA